MLDDILYDMPRPKPLKPFKPVLLKLPEEIVAVLDEDRKEASRAAYVAGLIMHWRQTLAAARPIAVIEMGAPKQADAKTGRMKPTPILTGRRVIGFDPQTGEPIYG